MSLNTAHTAGGVLIYSGECIILYSSGTFLDWSGNSHPAFQAKREGQLYLTTHRMIFLAFTGKRSDAFRSFSFPFACLSDVDVEQPVFGANYMKGKVRAQPNGGFVGEVKFKIVFKQGGAVDFCVSLLRACRIAKKFSTSDEPPPYVPPQGQSVQKEVCPPLKDYYGWNPPFEVFPEKPGAVWHSDAPPPYPGVTGTNVGWTSDVTPNGYFDPNSPHSAYVPPTNPAYYDPPPTYQETSNASAKENINTKKGL